MYGIFFFILLSFLKKTRETAFFCFTFLSPRKKSKWYPERDLNPYTQWITDFKSVASADSAIRALAFEYSSFFDFFKFFLLIKRIFFDKS